MGLVIPAVLLILTVPLVIAMMRANELFVLRARRGKLVPVRGRIPKELFDDIADVLARAGLDEFEIRGVIEDGRPRLHGGGAEVPRAVRQQLRNVVGRWRVAEIRNAPKVG